MTVVWITIDLSKSYNGELPINIIRLPALLFNVGGFDVNFTNYWSCCCVTLIYIYIYILFLIIYNELKLIISTI